MSPSRAPAPTAPALVNVFERCGASVTRSGKVSESVDKHLGRKARGLGGLLSGLLGGLLGIPIRIVTRLLGIPIRIVHRLVCHAPHLFCRARAARSSNVRLKKGV